jgi:hypothetical protein
MRLRTSPSGASSDKSAASRSLDRMSFGDPLGPMKSLGFERGIAIWFLLPGAIAAKVEFGRVAEQRRLQPAVSRNGVKEHVLKLDNLYFLHTCGM